jgi:hypothetical protein
MSTFSLKELWDLEVLYVPLKAIIIHQKPYTMSKYAVQKLLAGNTQTRIDTDTHRLVM